MKSFLGIDDLAPCDLDRIFSTAHKFHSGTETSQLLAGKVVCLAFFQPSTRTKISFQRAVLNLGGAWIGFSDIHESRSAPPFNESLEDCLRVLAVHSDFIVIRHHQSLRDLGHLDIPVINAGDGSNEHPLQALTDAFCLMERGVDFPSIRLGLVGDPTARVFRSVVKLMLRMGVRTFHGFSGFDEDLPKNIKEEIKNHGATYTKLNTLPEIIHASTVVEILPYKIPQHHRPPLEIQPELIVTRELVSSTNENVLILHPGPRAWELCKSTDSIKNSLFLEQMKVTCAVKMAAFELLSN